MTDSVLAPVHRICRQCRERHADERNTGDAFTFGTNGSPHRTLRGRP
ncbi:hypothetical protein [Streptomyces sp. NPDC047123]